MNRSLKSLFVVNSIFIFAAGLIGPLYTIFIQGFSIDPVAIATIPAIFMFFVIFFTLFIVKYGDSFRNTVMMLSLGFLLRAIGWGMFIFVSTYTGLCLIQIILALGESLGSPAFEVLVAEHLDKKLHVRDYSYWRIVSNVTGALSTIMGGVVVKYYGFISLFEIMSLIGVMCFLYTIFNTKKLIK